ncbi:MAG: SDR family NAD(P)-dependent oxidoreductase [Myxococcales bacterium]|nr:SDR family NAD(P)-dependent oxidoreductase [Myxococcales bacterium]
MSDWKGKVALVTGASSGIGAAVAEKLASEGMTVVVCARRVERLQALGEKLKMAPEQIIAADLRKEEDILSMFETIRKHWGGVDVLVNNAGLGRSTSLVNGDSEFWREMLELNVLALAICTREALQDMRRRGDNGHVIHISSMAGHRVAPNSGMYSASKHAVRALTEALRMELRELNSKIRVSAISPGFVETEFASIYSGSEDKAKELYSSLKALEPGDIAGAVWYILSSPWYMQVHDLLLRPTQQDN